MTRDRPIGHLFEPLSGRHWTPDETRVEVQHRSGCFWAQGMRRGDRVFINFGNRGDFLLDLLAIWSIGACAVPLDPRLSIFEVENLVKTATPRFFLFEDEIDTDLAKRLSALQVQLLQSGERHGATAKPAVPTLPDDEALILFTSGSTGEPKGVVHTHRTLLAQWSSLRQALDPACFRRSLCLLPTHFGHGLICNALFPWLSGHDLYLLPAFSPEVIMQLGHLIDEHAITFLSSVPAVWQMALKLAAPPNEEVLRQVFCGSAPLSDHLWRNIQDWSRCLRVANSYGITETASWVGGTTMDGFQPTTGLIGEPWGTEIKVLVDPPDDVPLDLLPGSGPGVEGPVWIKSPAVMRGYLDREDLSAQVLRDGWFVSGDIGMLDERGHLHLRGRKRDEINKGGMKIYPVDIEAVAERFPAVLDCCCFAYDAPPYGQGVGFAVALERSDREVIAGLYSWMAEHLAAHKMPSRWFSLEAIPRSSRGKVNRAKVAAACAEIGPIDMNAALQDAS